MAFFNIPATQTSPGIVETPDFSTRPGVSGFEQTIISATEFTLNPGCVRACASGGQYGINMGVYPGFTANLPGVYTVNVSSVWNYGAVVGGAFPFAINTLSLSSNNTVFPVYAIWDSANGSSPFTAFNQTGGIPNNFAVIIPTSADFLPVGYDSFARIGLVYINGTTFNIIPWLQTGHYEERNYVLADAVRVLTAGAATAPTLVDLTTGSGPVMPGTAKVLLLVEYQSNVQTDSLMLIPTGLTSASVPPVQFENAVVGVNTLSNVEMAPGIDVTTGHAGIDYFATSALDVSNIWVSGWTDSMGVALR